MDMNWRCFVMFGIGLSLIFLAIRKKYEPALLLPLGFGAILMNLPQASSGGILEWLFEVGINQAEAMPFLLFVGIGAMIDFTPLFENPWLALFGIFSQAGIFIVYMIARKLGFSPADAASIGIIGAADGPTAILVSRKLNSAFVGQISLAAYSYIALVPLIQPFVVRLLTTRKERQIRVEIRALSDDASADGRRKLIRILFPIGMTFVSGFIAPESAQLTGFLMFGNLLKECGVLDNLALTAKTTLVNLITLFLGITVSFTLQAQVFIQPATLLVLGLGLAAFVFDIASGVLVVKVFNIFMKKKMNPLVGSAGISAFPISSHVAQKLALEEDPSNIILMHATAANVSGQLCSAIIGGILIRMGL